MPLSGDLHGNVHPVWIVPYPCTRVVAAREPDQVELDRLALDFDRKLGDRADDGLRTALPGFLGQTLCREASELVINKGGQSQDCPLP